MSVFLESPLESMVKKTNPIGADMLVWPGLSDFIFKEKKKTEISHFFSNNVGDSNQLIFSP